jgi:hypothetical protein
MNDLKFALRQLRKSPGFTLIAVITIALGIGATTAIFTVVDATLLEPLPYPHAEQLVTIQDDLSGVGARDVGMSQPEWEDLQRSGIFEYVSPTWFDENNLAGSEQPARVRLLIAPARSVFGWHSGHKRATSYAFFCNKDYNSQLRVPRLALFAR